IGAGAHGKITLADRSVLRTYKTKHPKQYLSGNPYLVEAKKVAQEELPFEFMLNALRLNQAIDLQLFTARTGLSQKTIATILESAQAQGFIEIAQEKISKTKKGEHFLNDLLTLFLK